ncbi:AAC(3) family N-acetyltransferase [Candidatus Bipolaricaulota bacterium]|nr:AAC(3) family N-acetyltransferase [Candidatus Bipolaricaulota bacterium]
MYQVACRKGLAACVCAPSWNAIGIVAVSEHDVIQNTRVPVTVKSLKTELCALGVQRGMVLLVHSAQSALGWVCGGPVAVIAALQEILGPEGTLVMPAYTGGLTDPKNWQNPPVPEDWKDTIRAEMPAFDPLRTPSREMGCIAETFRTWPDVIRSSHPHCSFSAWGAHAIDITRDHALEYGMGEGSPLARIYDLDGWVLLLGVGFGNNSSLHLSEYRATYPGKAEETNGAPMWIDGQRQWVPIRDLELDADDFVCIGESFMKQTQAVRSSKIGEGVALLMPQRAAVDYAIGWMETYRAEK